MTRTAAGLLMVGSLVFGLGAQVGVPAVFLTPDAETRFKLLERRMAHWRLAQPLYAGGPVLASIGIGLFGASSPVDTFSLLFLLAALLMLGGNVAWSYDCLLRGLHPRRFAFGELPGWPFRVYVLTTIAGLGIFAGGLAGEGYSAWLSGAVVVADVFFLAFYLLTKDIPPFFFYVLLLVVGLVLALDPGAKGKVSQQPPKARRRATPPFHGRTLARGEGRRSGHSCLPRRLPGLAGRR